jgi:phosphatidylethanolamine/phosphatidyl-N-methylethanolamine N-methyltransferase
MIKRTFSKMAEKTSALMLFAREILNNPREIGAACPSSPILARAMANALPTHLNGVVIELGAGTGTITAALLARGIPSEKLLVLERSANMVKHLREKFPQLQIIEGDAAQLSAYLTKGTKVAAIVSGLPLRSLPVPLMKEIVKQINRLLHHDGILIQFTYDLRGEWFEQQHKQFRRAQSTIIWRNLPPARVDVFRKR